MSKPIYNFDGKSHDIKASFEETIEEQDRKVFKTFKEISPVVTASTLEELRYLADTKMQTTNDIKPNRCICNNKYTDEDLINLHDLDVFRSKVIDEDTFLFVYMDSERYPLILLPKASGEPFQYEIVTKIGEPGLSIIGKLEAK